jgi:WD40 repeat protein
MIRLDLESGSTIPTLEGHTRNSARVLAVAVTADGRRAVTGSYDGGLRLWDLESGQMIRTLEGDGGRILAVAVTGDGRRALSGSDDGGLQLWDLESGQTIRTLVLFGDRVLAVAVTVDGRRALSASDDRTLRLWDPENGSEIAIFIADSSINSCTFAGDGRRIVAGDASGQVHFLELVEVDATKPGIGETKIQLLRCEELAN